MTGLVVSGKISALHRENRTKLFLIERSGSRAKADTRIRNRADGEYTEGDTLRLDRVDVERIACDLAHVDIDKALQGPANEEERLNVSTLAIAKHLCGAGTDLALKSLSHRQVGLRFSSCVFATCCHGLCNWSDYVGRDCFLELFAPHLPFFGERDFAQLARWTAATVLDDVVVEDPQGRKLPKGEDQDGEKEHGSGVLSSESANEDNFVSIHKIVKELGLACGHRGLARAAQRVIDHGRCEYIRSVLLPGCSIEMNHYVPKSVTPQNCLIVATS